jgi:hypothetical protein
VVFIQIYATRLIRSQDIPQLARFAKDSCRIFAISRYDLAVLVLGVADMVLKPAV